MLYIFFISTSLNCVLLILFFIRLLLNKNKIDFKNNKFGWQTLMSLIILSIVPMVNIFMVIYNAYISLLMKNDNFIQIMNE